jgi:hypothetical protein
MNHDEDNLLDNITFYRMLMCLTHIQEAPCRGLSIIVCHFSHLLPPGKCFDRSLRHDIIISLKSLRIRNSQAYYLDYRHILWYQIQKLFPLQILLMNFTQDLYKLLYKH